MGRQQPLPNAGFRNRVPMGAERFGEAEMRTFPPEQDERSGICVVHNLFKKWQNI